MTKNTTVELKIDNPDQLRILAEQGLMEWKEAAKRVLLLVGWSEQEIVRVVGSTKPAPRKKVPTSHKGRGRPSSLTPEKLQNLREMVEAGISQANMAATLDVSVPTVRNWIHKLDSQDATVAAPDIEVAPDSDEAAPEVFAGEEPIQEHATA